MEMGGLGDGKRGFDLLIFGGDQLIRVGAVAERG